VQEEGEKGCGRSKPSRRHESNGNGVAFSDYEVKEAQEVEFRCDFESGGCSVARSVTSLDTRPTAKQFSARWRP
jgi:hypothetical protein